MSVRSRADMVVLSGADIGVRVIDAVNRPRKNRPSFKEDDLKIV